MSEAAEEGMPAGQSYYDSIAQAAKGMGCTVALLRRAKKEGAPGFRGSRVYPKELLPWLQAWREAGGDVDPRGALEMDRLERQVKLLDMEIAEREGKTWNAELASACWLQHMMAARQVWLNTAAGLAPQLAGHNVAEIERKLVAAIDAGLEKLRGNPYGDASPAQLRCPHCSDARATDLGKAKDGTTTDPGASGESAGAHGERAGQEQAAGGANDRVPADGGGLHEGGGGQPGEARGAAGRNAAARSRRKAGARDEGMETGAAEGAKKGAPAGAQGRGRHRRGKRGGAVRKL